METEIVNIVNLIGDKGLLFFGLYIIYKYFYQIFMIVFISQVVKKVIFRIIDFIETYQERKYMLKKDLEALEKRLTEKEDAKNS